MDMSDDVSMRPEMTRLAVVRHEWLRDCEGKAGSDARAAIAAAAAKNDRASVRALCGYAEQARVECGNERRGGPTRSSVCNRPASISLTCCGVTTTA